MGAGDTRSEHVTVDGADVLVHRRGEGPPLLVLHGEDGLLFTGPFIQALSSSHEVIAPALPGWPGSDRPEHVTRPQDLAFACLELVAALGTGPVPVVGLSMGAWVAAEMAVWQPRQLSAQVLCAPVGVKFGGRQDRAFVDIYATGAADVRALQYADPADVPDLAEVGFDELLMLAEAQEAVARYAWEPYFHEPKLRHRLRRIAAPTLVVAGDADRFLLEGDIAERWAGAIGDAARAVTLPGVGHRIEEEVPGELAALVTDFLRTVDDVPAPALAGQEES
ncbi:alpha/beta fold hydrolase [Rhabdothermincola salaria]|uniref:alpha/beta fold hydrolase n=1 Tax=Rhabdothermincola salaria TaxID=2903142 RepID=UPI001E564E53|nr:alpha/beta fold hydrolase [Rhabdothermincola salaria]MCD9623948.1 alpha/beta fold hydrolase [Rhabdothermincola salaria]